MLSVLAILGCADFQRSGAPRVLGHVSGVGKGTASSYAEFDASGAPRAIGVLLQAGALEGLPSDHSEGHHCYDRNKDGKLDLENECSGWYEWVIPLPSEAARNPDIPFKWVGLNWNPHGHIPPGVYDLPHFDVHFYMAPIASVYSIEAGGCGPEYVRCDQFAIATKPLPARYAPPDYQSVDAVAPAMGNHLIDLTSPEFHGHKFTRTWIYGTYDGRVTFYEEMVTREYLLSRPAKCFPLKSPPAVDVTGYYPTQSCIRYLAPEDAYTVSMEGFVLRKASGG